MDDEGSCEWRTRLWMTKEVKDEWGCRRRSRSWPMKPCMMEESMDAWEDCGHKVGQNHGRIHNVEWSHMRSRGSDIEWGHIQSCEEKVGTLMANLCRYVWCIAWERYYCEEKKMLDWSPRSFLPIAWEKMQQQTTSRYSDEWCPSIKFDRAPIRSNSDD